VPAFGNVLAAIGGAVAESQKGFDKAVTDSINKLNATKIDVVSQVVIDLDDNGLPFGDASHTHLVTNNVSVLQYYTPVFHAWKRVDVAMDLSVGEFHAQQGVTFSQKQSSTSIGGGLSWSGAFGGWFSASHSSSQQKVEINTQSDAEWVSGQLLVDAEIGVRKTVEFPPAAEIAIGPRILIQQGDITETKDNNGKVDSRTIALNIQVRKASGEVLPNAPLEVEPTTAALVTIPSADPNGKIACTITRNVPPGSTALRQIPLTFKLGDLRRPYEVTL
jgi:hypothetical protein